MNTKFYTSVWFFLAFSLMACPEAKAMDAQTFDLENTFDTPLVVKLKKTSGEDLGSQTYTVPPKSTLSTSLTKEALEPINEKQYRVTVEIYKEGTTFEKHQMLSSSIVPCFSSDSGKRKAKILPQLSNEGEIHLNKSLECKEKITNFFLERVLNKEFELNVVNKMSQDVFFKIEIQKKGDAQPVFSQISPYLKRKSETIKVPVSDELQTILKNLFNNTAKLYTLGFQVSLSSDNWQPFITINERSYTDSINNLAELYKYFADTIVLDYTVSTE